jgi:TetR/AcrR family transcriptional regulator
MRDVPLPLAAKLTAAADSFIATFDDIRMEDIAKSTGIPRATLYYYFSGKDDVLAFLLRSMLDELTETVNAAATGTGDAATRLLAVIRAQLEHLAAHPATSQLLIANLGKAGKLPDIASRLNDGFDEPVRRILEEGAADGTLNALEDPQLGATALFGAVLVIGLRAIVLEGGIDVERVVSEIGPMFWHGLAPASPSKVKRARSRATRDD